VHKKEIVERCPISKIKGDKGINYVLVYSVAQTFLRGF
jgi:hypothetical protein